MLRARDAGGVRREVDVWRREGEAIALVPTMGALHAGHMSLLEAARRTAGRVVVSVFVNPTQFGPGEDFNLYPRQLGSDSAMLEAAGCDLLFAPDVETMYPPGNATFVDPGGAALGLEGERRQGHFRGVATVVSVLFHIVRPDVAVFGEKDAQQLAVIRQLNRDLRLDLQIVAAPTVRDADGVALSSRNIFLSQAERRAATVLHAALSEGAARIAGGERRAGEVRAAMARTVQAEPLAQLDYAEVVDVDSFRPLTTLAAGGRIVLPIAARLGRTRLIDNFHLTVPAGEAMPSGGGADVPAPPPGLDHR